MTLIEAKRHIDSFSRPSGFNVYSWRAVKKMAFNAWTQFLEGRRLNRNYNFMCKEFYEMTNDELGQSILSMQKVSCHFPGLISR